MHYTNDDQLIFIYLKKMFPYGFQKFIITYVDV
jgi:hypothetical protein